MMSAAVAAVMRVAAAAELGLGRRRSASLAGKVLLALEHRQAAPKARERPRR